MNESHLDDRNWWASPLDDSPEFHVPLETDAGPDAFTEWRADQGAAQECALSTTGQLHGIPEPERVATMMVAYTNLAWSVRQWSNN